MNLSVAETKEIASLLKRKKDGLSAKDVVDFAKLPGSALHRRFEWDDAKAALGYRLEIARDILQSFKITVERKTEGEREVTFVVAPGAVSTGEGFRDVRLVMKDETFARAQIEYEWRRIRTQLERLASLCALDGSALAAVGEFAASTVRQGDALIFAEKEEEVAA